MDATPLQRETIPEPAEVSANGKLVQQSANGRKLVSANGRKLVQQATTPVGSTAARAATSVSDALGLDHSKHFQSKWPISRYVIDPRSSKWIGYLDGVTCLALIFTAVCTPWEVSFVPACTQPNEPWFIANRFVDVIFVIDVVLQFFLCYLEPATATSAARWVHSPRAIARHYVSSPWFSLDILSIGVSAFDYVALESPNAPKAVVDGRVVVPMEGRDDQNLSTLKAFRVLRALRLIKLLVSSL